MISTISKIEKVAGILGLGTPDNFSDIQKYNELFSKIQEKHGFITQVVDDNNRIPGPDEVKKKLEIFVEAISKLKDVAKEYGVICPENFWESPEAYEKVRSEVLEHYNPTDNIVELFLRCKFELSKLDSAKQFSKETVQKVIPLLSTSYEIFEYYKKLFPELGDKIEPLLEEIRPAYEFQENVVQKGGASKKRGDEIPSEIESNMVPIFSRFIETSELIRNHVVKNEFIKKLISGISTATALTIEITSYKEVFEKLGISIEDAKERGLPDILIGTTEDLNSKLSRVQEEVNKIYKSMFAREPAPQEAPKEITSFQEEIKEDERLKHLYEPKTPKETPIYEVPKTIPNDKNTEIEITPYEEKKETKEVPDKKPKIRLNLSKLKKIKEKVKDKFKRENSGDESKYPHFGNY